jgi:Glycosyl hydrolase family 79 C-terminal beta domain
MPLAVFCAVGLANCRAASADQSTVLTIGSRPTGRTIQPGFVGLSMEYPEVTGYTGSDPGALNPVFLQLVKNLAPGQRPVLRIGGDSADWSWYPVPGMRKPPGIRYTLTSSWMAVGHALAAALDARLILGVNLEADSGRLAATMAKALMDGIGPSYIAGLELGNEPELYDGFPWYITPHGSRVLGRPKATWNFDRFLRDYSTIAQALPSGPLAAPDIGSPAWMVNLRRFLDAQRHTSLITLHRYPLKRCSASHHLTAAELLSEESSKGLADSVASYARLAHARRLPIRVDEMNSISCGGQRGLSDTFASSLWAVDALFEMARVGIDGVNIHTTPRSINELFHFERTGTTWSGQVRPIYYGLMMFAQAAPAGSQLLMLSGNSSTATLRTWATRASDGTVHVVLINVGSRARTVKLRVPPQALSTATATLTRLQAPSLRSQTGVTLGGQGFGAQTTTGQLSGPPRAPTLSPQNGIYAVSLPATSATMLTIPGR